jgi:pectate lyase
MKHLLFLTMFLVFFAGKIIAQDGYCMVNGTTTGGKGGSIVTVSNATDLINYAKSSSAYIIKVSGTITLTSRLDVAANKTIEGINSSSKIIGNISIGVNNVIIRNLTFTNPSGYGLGDGISIWGGTHVWVDHVTFFDCADGCCDINHLADYVTVSYCKFYYINQTDHRFAMILGGDPYDAPGDKLHVTLHHNWFADKCDQRMPSGSYSNAHIYNNYFSCSGNSYCTNARIGTHWLVQNNYYKQVNNPCYYENGGIMQISGNNYDNCTGKQTTASNGTVKVPYSYSLTSTSDVPSVVMASAGNIIKSAEAEILYDIIVAKDGTGNYTTVQSAINSVTANKTTRTVIYIKNGTYKEVITVESNKTNITLIGQSVDGVKLTYNNAASAINPVTGKAYGTGSASFLLQGSGFYAQNITFENSYGTGSQALAINISGDKAVFNNCKFLGRQDTWYASNCRVYLKNCYIEGTTDFIFGSATAFFDGCTIYSYGGSAITAANTASYVTYGLVFKNCTITGASGVSTLLGRTWRAYAATAFINCSISSIIAPSGWSDWGNAANQSTARYCEYGNTGPGASTDNRVSWCKILTSSEAEAFTYLNVLKTTYSSSPITDNWDPMNIINSTSSFLPIISGSTYSIIAKHSGKGLDVTNASTANGANIQQWNFVGTANQQFIITHVDGVFYKIINVNSGKGLDVAGGSTANYANIQQWNYNSQYNQQFKFISTGDGYYQIVNRNSGKCLDVKDASTSNGANVQQYDCSSGDNQRWKLTLIKSAPVNENIESPLSVESINTSDFSIYPSPSNNGTFYININSNIDNKIFNMEIYNIEGKQVYKKQIVSGTKIETGLKSGVYIIYIKTNNINFVKKLIIE